MSTEFKIIQTFYLKFERLHSFRKASTKLRPLVVRALEVYERALFVQQKKIMRRCVGFTIQNSFLATNLQQCLSQSG